METFVKPKPFVKNPDYQRQKQTYLRPFDINTIDEPIVDIVAGFAKLPFCFTLQSCYGHFVYAGKDRYNIDPLPVIDNIAEVEYRIAYIALCIENSDNGKALYLNLSNVASIDPEYIQFGCADWFWERQVNSYVLQLEPKRYKLKDSALVDYQEALHLEKVRAMFFDELGEILDGKGLV